MGDELAKFYPEGVDRNKLSERMRRQLDEQALKRMQTEQTLLKPLGMEDLGGEKTVLTLGKELSPLDIPVRAHGGSTGGETVVAAAPHRSTRVGAGVRAPGHIPKAVQRDVGVHTAIVKLPKKSSL